MNATERLAELRESARDAANAHSEARAEQDRTARAVGGAREALTVAYASGDSDAIKVRKRELEKAQVAAADGALVARVEGLARAERTANAAVQAHVEANLSELVEAYRPRAEAVVAEITERAHALNDALREWSSIDQEIGTMTGGVQWFVAARRRPQDPFDDLRRNLTRIISAEVPAPLPSSTLDPAAEAERVEAAIEAHRAETAAAWRPFRQPA